MLTLSAVARQLQLRRVLRPGVATAMLAGRTHTRLVGPVDLAALLGGTPLDLGVLRVQPLLDFLGVLLVRLFDRLLRRVAPAVEVLADRADGHVLPGLLLDQFPDSGAGPQGRRDAQLLWRLLVDESLNGGFLVRVEVTARANRAAGAIAREGLLAALLVLDAPARHRLLTDAQDGGDVYHRVAFLPGSDGPQTQGFEDLIGLRTPIRQFDGHCPTPTLPTPRLPSLLLSILPFARQPVVLHL